MSDPLLNAIQRTIEPHLKRGADSWGLSWELARQARSAALDELLESLRDLVIEKQNEGKDFPEGS